MARIQPLFESLESRVLLAGDVTVIAAGGNLYFYGDTQSNDFVVTGQPGNHVVFTTGPGTTTFNHLSGPQTFTVTGSVMGWLGGGTDQFEYDGAALSGDLDIFAGFGINYVTVKDAGISGALNYFGNVSNDHVTLDHVSAARGVYIDGSMGDNAVTISSLTCISGGLTVLGSLGDDTLTGDHVFLSTGMLVSTGPGAATMSLTTGNLGGAFTVITGGTSAPGVDYATSITLDGIAIPGATTIIGGLGDDYFLARNGCTFIGDVLMSAGPDAAYVQFQASNLLRGFTSLRAGGGALPGGMSDYSGIVSFVTTNVTNALNVFGATGNTSVEFTGPSVSVGSVFVSGGAGALALHVNNVRVYGAVTAIAGGTNRLSYLPDFSAYYEFIGTRIDSGLTLIGAAGPDKLEIDQGETHGAVAAFFGPDAIDATFYQTHLYGSTTIFRGDGNTTSRVDAGDIFFNGSQLDGAVLIITGAGQDYPYAQDSTFGSNVTVNTGPGVGVLTFRKNSGTMSVVGNLDFTSSDGSDAVTLRGITITGTTNLSLGLGFDSLTIDDATFTGAVTANMGPVVAPASSDNDNIYIETTTGTTGTTLFSAMPRFTMGDGTDWVTIGSAGDATRRATFTLGFYVDGGLGTNIVDYLGHGNVILGPVTLVSATAA